jgi:hypothetical protein
MQAHNTIKDKTQTLSKVPDADLFTTNSALNTNKREKLRDDRFKRNAARGVSLVDALLIKKIKAKGPSTSEAKEENHLGDLWSTPASAKTLNQTKYSDFVDRSFTKVKAVIMPFAG